MGTGMHILTKTDGNVYGHPASDLFACRKIQQSSPVKLMFSTIMQGEHIGEVSILRVELLPEPNDMAFLLDVLAGHCSL